MHVFLVLDLLDHVVLCHWFKQTPYAAAPFTASKNRLRNLNGAVSSFDALMTMPSFHFCFLRLRMRVLCDVKSDRGRMQLFVKLLRSRSLSSLSRRRDLFQWTLCVCVSMLLLEAAPDLTCSCNGPRPVACHTFNAFQHISAELITNYCYSSLIRAVLHIFFPQAPYRDWRSRNSCDLSQVCLRSMAFGTFNSFNVPGID